MMEETFNQKQDKYGTLYIAPNCGIELDYKKEACVKGFGCEYRISNIEKYCNLGRDENDNHTRGWLAPLRPLSLNEAARCRIGIPLEAVRYSYVYPSAELYKRLDKKKIGSKHDLFPESQKKKASRDFSDGDTLASEEHDFHSQPYTNINTTKQPVNIYMDLSSRERKAKKLAEKLKLRKELKDLENEAANEGQSKWALLDFASFGAYAYFDENYDLLRVNAVTLRETKFRLNLEGPYKAVPDAYKKACDVNRYKPFYIDVLTEAGFGGFGWIFPGDNQYFDRKVKGQETVVNRHGSFLFFDHDKSATIFLVAGRNYTMVSRKLSVGGLFHDALQYHVTNKKESTYHHDENVGNQYQKNILSCLSKNDPQNFLKKHLQDDGDSFRNTDSFGWTALHYACCYLPQDHATISKIIDAYPDVVSMPNKNNLYPLHIALQNNACLEVIKLLLDKYSHALTAKSKHLELLPIHIACGCEKTSIEVIRILIEKDKSKQTLEGTSKMGYNCLCRAIYARHDFEVIQEIYSIYKESNIDPWVEVDGMSLIHLAVIKGCSVKTIMYLLNEQISMHVHELLKISMYGSKPKECRGSEGHSGLYRSIAVTHYNLIQETGKTYNKKPEEIRNHYLHDVHQALLKGSSKALVSTVHASDSYDETSDLVDSNILHLALEYATPETVNAIITEQIRF